MKKVFSIIISSILLSSLIIFSVYAKDLIKFGKEIKLKEKTNVSQVLKEPKKYIGKNILIEGTILAVSPKDGCWIKISSDKKYETIVIKANEGEMTFLPDFIGKKVKAEGQIYFHSFQEHKGCLYKEQNGIESYMLKPISVEILN